jgi:uncharacterized protein YlxP (DUF503 family)
VTLGYGALDLHLPHCRDLKGKRRLVRGLVDRLHARHRISVAETGGADLLQRAIVEVAVVARDGAEVERILETVFRTVDQDDEMVVLDWDTRIIEDEE